MVFRLIQSDAQKRVRLDHPEARPECDPAKLIRVNILLRMENGHEPVMRRPRTQPHEREDRDRAHGRGPPLPPPKEPSPGYRGPKPPGPCLIQEQPRPQQ